MYTNRIKNCKSPQWIETIPLKYEYGSECHFYVRVLQTGGPESKKSPKGKSTVSPTNNGSEVIESSSFHGTPEKDRMGHCFGTALFEVGDILGSRNYTKVKRLKAGGWYVEEEETVCHVWCVYLI